ncbi:hypothetical protein BdWA1_001183 [Babesia duncani]|uniref:Uncharacterized protein n=1 Tax=Babesia duncani TaxID=323732 RepID=A0AAD9PGK5_9APIC|nr:hypothetical protein BdWA1_004178 [Babesia duncani]KAK2194930.1 hypothetical protein BdWA1_003609 [Babesia duncani]KAK2198174.1 hypothetical protein BdWA1_001183 [Babesia duncani]
MPGCDIGKKGSMSKELYINSNIATDLGNAKLPKSAMQKPHLKRLRRCSSSIFDNAGIFNTQPIPSVCNYRATRLDPAEQENLRRLYIQKVGQDYSDVGLKTYIDSVVDAQRFRERCFYILSGRSKTCTAPIDTSASDDPQFDNFNDSIDLENVVESPIADFDTPNRPFCMPYTGVQLDPPPPKRSQRLWSSLGSADQTYLEQMGQDYGDGWPRGPIIGETVTEQFNVQQPPQMHATENAQYEVETQPGECIKPTTSQAPKMQEDELLHDFFKENYTLIPSNCDLEALSHAEKLTLLKQLNLENDYIAMKLCCKFNYKTSAQILRPLADFSMYGKLDAGECPVDHDALFSETSLFDAKNANVLNLTLPT